MSERKSAAKRPVHPAVDVIGTVLSGAVVFTIFAQLYSAFAP